MKGVTLLSDDYLNMPKLVGINLSSDYTDYKIVNCVSQDHHKKVRFGASHTNRNCTVDSAHCVWALTELRRQLTSTIVIG